MAVITLEELKMHDGGDSAWVAIHGKVYDVTNFEDVFVGPTQNLFTFLLASTWLRSDS